MGGNKILIPKVKFLLRNQLASLKEIFISTSKVKIAIIAPSYLPVPAVNGGAVETLINIFIDKNEEIQLFDITVFSFFNSEAIIKSQKYQYTSFFWLDRTFRFKLLNFGNRFLRKFFRTELPYDEKFILKKISHHKFDRVIVESNTRFALSISNKIPHEKLFLHVHANLFKNESEHLKLVANQCGTIITVSKFIKNEIIKTTGIAEKKIKVLLNCPNPRIANEYHLDATLDNTLHNFCKTEDEVVITYVGRIVPSKGIKELFSALILILKEVNFKLLLVGNTDSKFGAGKLKTPYYNELININENLNKRIIFTGYIPNEKLAAIHSITDIAIVPSIEDEAAPLAIIESITFGIPVIASDSGGIPEYLNNDTGIIVKRDKDFVQNLSLALKKLIEDKETRLKMSQNAKIRAKEFSADNYYFRFHNILNSNGPII